MSRVAAAAAAFALAWSPATALPCGSSDGGSSGGSSGGGSSGGGSSSSGDGSSSSSVSACYDDSVVVGRKQCSSFGTWDVSRWPRLRLGVGTSFHSFSTADARFKGTAQHDRTIQYRIADDDLGRDSRATGGTFDLRVTGKLGQWFYVGGEGSIGAAAVANPRIMNTAGDLKLEPNDAALYLSTGAIIGLAVPADRFTFTAEMVTGIRGLGLTTTSYYGDCVDESVAWETDLWVQSRAGVQTWLGPWSSLTAWIGSDPRDRSDVSFGLVLRGHVRAFDAAR